MDRAGRKPNEAATRLGIEAALNWPGLAQVLGVVSHYLSGSNLVSTVSGFFSGS